MKRTFAYRVDADNRLVWVAAEWLAFAGENQASHLSTDTVIGRPLFDFVTGREIRHLYQMIIDRVRRTQRSIVVPFRCDSPSVRRFMELEVSPGANDHVEFAGRIIHEEEREAIALLDSSVDRSDEQVVVCSWCKRLQVWGDWFEVEEGVRQMELFHLERMPQITHGICVDCTARMRVATGDAE